MWAWLGINDIPSLGGGGRDAHRAVAAVDTLHLDEGTLLVLLVAEPNKAVATRLTGHSIGHDLGRLAGRKASLEKGDKDELVDLGTEITDEDAILGATVIAGMVVSISTRLQHGVDYLPAINKTATRSPVQLEDTLRVGDRSAVQSKSLLSSLGGGKLNEAVASIARDAVRMHSL